MTSSVAQLEARAKRATYFIAGAYATALAMRMLSSIVLSHLFAPDVFGLMAILTTAMVGMSLLSHLGLEDSIIQSPRGDEREFLDTAWTLQVIRGLLLTLTFIPLAWPLAHYYRDPRIVYLLPVAGMTLLFESWSSPNLYVLARHMGVGRTSALELLDQVTGLVATIAVALLFHSIWALIAGRLAGSLSKAAATYILEPRLRPRWYLDRKIAHGLIHFGKWILISTGLTFLATQSDKLILGRMAGLRTVGIYGIAFSLSDLPRQIVALFSRRVAYPFIARFATLERGEYRAVVLKYRKYVLLAGNLLVLGVLAVGDQFVLHVYDSRYHQAAWMITILALGLWHTLLYSTTSPAVLALSRSHYSALAYALNCLALYVSLPLAYHHFGMFGAIVAIALSDFPVYVVNALAARHEGVGLLRQDLLYTLLFAASATGLVAVRAAMHLPLRFWP